MATLIDISVKPAVGAPVAKLEEAIVDYKTGIDGNHHSRRTNRMVTILFKDTWEAALAEAGADLDWTTRRANFFVDGITLADCKGKLLQIGEVKLEITGETKPCNLMDEAFQGLRSALASDWRGGVTCKVVQGGTVKIGDGVRVLEKVSAE